MLSEFLIRSNNPAMAGETDEGEMIGANTQQNKSVKAAALLLLLVLLVGGLIAVLTSMMGGMLARILHAAGFLALGTVHLRMSSIAFGVADRRRQLLFVLVSVGALLGALFVVQLFFPSYSWLQTLSALSAFTLPFVLHELWRFYNLFTVGAGKTWSYSDDLSLQKSTTFLNSMPVRFKVQLEDGGELQYQVSFKAPVRMKLGLIFYHMVQSQQNTEGVPIRFVDAMNEPYTWIFQTSQFGFTRSLDPDLGLIENGIRQNTLVIAKRLQRDKQLRADGNGNASNEQNTF